MRHLFYGCLVLSSACGSGPVEFEQLDGGRYSYKELHSARATVFVFLSPECPLSENYTLTVKQIAADYACSGIPVYGVFPGTLHSRQAIETFCNRYDFHIPCLLDPEHRLRKKLGASITPEAFVLDSMEAVIYRGAIDNWAVTLGRQRKKPSMHYLRDALDEFLAGKPITTPRTKAVGCVIE